jgi:hypothetical protein
MVDNIRNTDKSPVSPTGGRREWSTPRLLEYGHIGKLTQGASGTKGETSGKKVCL